MSFDFEEVFDEDYLYFYEPWAEEVTEPEVEAIWRLGSATNQRD